MTISMVTSLRQYVAMTSLVAVLVLTCTIFKHVYMKNVLKVVFLKWWSIVDRLFALQPSLAWAGTCLPRKMSILT